MATNAVANINETIVLGVIPSFIKYAVRMAKTIIPKLNPTNLPGHKSPPNPSTIYLVDKISKNDMGAPNIANRIGCSANHFHTN